MYYFICKHSKKKSATKKKEEAAIWMRVIIAEKYGELKRSLWIKFCLLLHFVLEGMANSCTRHRFDHIPYSWFLLLIFALQINFNDKVDRCVALINYLISLGQLVIKL